MALYIICIYNYSAWDNFSARYFALLFGEYNDLQQGLGQEFPCAEESCNKKNITHVLLLTPKHLVASHCSRQSLD